MRVDWLGKDAGVRKPMTGETPLSPAEIAVGLRTGAFKPPAGRYGPVPVLQLPLLHALSDAGDDGATARDLAAATGLDPNLVSKVVTHLRQRCGLVQTHAVEEGSRCVRHWLRTVEADKVRAALVRARATRVAEGAQREREAAVHRLEAKRERAAALSAKAAESRRAAEASRRAPPPLRLPKPQPALAQDIPEHLIQRIPSRMGRFEGLTPAGVIPSRIGEYSDGSAWAKAVSA
jgi:DNA-binding MarR family transcriptional regulator